MGACGRKGRLDLVFQGLNIIDVKRGVAVADHIKSHPESLARITDYRFADCRSFHDHLVAQVVIEKSPLCWKRCF